jgi:hypothetical protein
MSDVFRATTLSFLIAVVYLSFSGCIDYLAINHLQLGDERFTAQDKFRMALATASLLASLLCVWVLLVCAFARKYIRRLRPNTTLIAAFLVAAPIVLLQRLLPLIDEQLTWAPTVSLVFALIWSSLGLHTLLWFLTLDGAAPE